MNPIVLLTVTLAAYLVLSACVTYQPPGDGLWLVLR
jgi:hypothetical protein